MEEHTFHAPQHILVQAMVMAWFCALDCHSRIWSLFSSIRPVCMALGVLSLKVPEAREDMSQTRRENVLWNVTLLRLRT